MPSQPKSWQQTLQELWDLLRAYAQQETIGPLRNLGRQIGLGLAGSFCVALGYLFLVIGVMRGLQSHTQFFSEHNYLTYLVAAVLLILGCVVAYTRAKGKGKGATGGTSVLDSGDDLPPEPEPVPAAPITVAATITDPAVPPTGSVPPGEGNP